MIEGSIQLLEEIVDPLEVRGGCGERRVQGELRARREPNVVTDRLEGKRGGGARPLDSPSSGQ
jgi:hypothetical protein